jgi:hypothetical protein
MGTTRKRATLAANPLVMARRDELVLFIDVGDIAFRHPGAHPGGGQAGPGRLYDLYNLLMALLDPGDEVIVPAPCWVSYPDMVRLAGGVPVIVETTADESFLMTPEDLRAATPRAPGP